MRAAAALTRPVSRTAATTRSTSASVSRGWSGRRRSVARDPVGDRQLGAEAERCGRAAPSAAGRSGTSPAHPRARSAPRASSRARAVRVEQEEDVVVRLALRELRGQPHARARPPSRRGPRGSAPRPRRAAPGSRRACRAARPGSRRARRRARSSLPSATQVYLSTSPRKNARAVRALLARDLGPPRDLGVANDERAALAAGDVLRLVEAEAAGVAERAERRGRASAAAKPCAASSTTRRPRRAGDLEERVHVGRDARVVHRAGARPSAA